jgi:predicted lipoprotein with Yx(FWY)xxD motif
MRGREAARAASVGATDIFDQEAPMTVRAPAYALGALTALALVAGCGGSSSSSNETSTAAGSGGAMREQSGAETVKTSSTDLGTFLVDGEGKTIYLFERDRGPKSTCNGACLQKWPAVTTEGKPHAGGEVKASLLGTSKRTDGTMQVTYASHPLYYYAGDSAAGDTNGQGIDAFGAEWYVLGTDGQKIEGHEEGDDSGGGGGSRGY